VITVSLAGVANGDAGKNFYPSHTKRFGNLNRAFLFSRFRSIRRIAAPSSERSPRI